MPVFRRRKVFNLVRGAKVLLGVEAGVTRGAGLGPAWAVAPDGRRGGVAPENVVWIFGTGRTGSTWLAAMMQEPRDHHVWFEPRVGVLFDPKRFERYEGAHFILGDQYRETWLNSIRKFILDGANARFPKAATGGYLIVKEPSGSKGAQLLMEAMPESRMVLLIRDPRDVVASWLDANREGSWRNELKGENVGKIALKADRDPDVFVRKRAETYLQNVGNAKEAYEAHEGYKVLVRYEDLRVDTLGEMRRLYSELGIPVDAEELERAVKKHSWENIPEEEKGEGKFYRKATPEGWREDLTPKQVKIVERITAPLLEEFYSE